MCRKALGLEWDHYVVNSFLISIIIGMGFLISVVLLIIFYFPEPGVSDNVIMILGENQTFIPAKISDLEPNSAHFFIYPSNASMQLYNYWLLIRLPESLVGDKDDESFLRAFHMMDLQSSCRLDYWPSRMQLVDPCHATMYDVITGIAVDGPGMNIHFQDNALPRLDLEIIDNYVYVRPPKFTIEENGVLGYGRIPK